MATFSVYLILVLNNVIQSSCGYCYLSAFLSISMAIVAWYSDYISNKTKAFAISATSVSLTSILSVFLFYITSALSVPPDSVNASTGLYRR